MTQPPMKLQQKIVVAMIFIGGLSIAFGFATLRLEMHKHSMERIAGHRISWWDAIWTE